MLEKYLDNINLLVSKRNYLKMSIRWGDNMDMISTNEALNTIAWVLYFGTPIIIVLLFWIGVTLRGIKKKLDE